MSKPIRVSLAVAVLMLLAACTAPPATLPPTSTPTLPPPTATHTPVPPSPTPLPPTDTPVPPTDTPLPPTATFTASPTATETATPTPQVNLCSQAPSISGASQKRLTVVNKSGYDVYIRLEDCGGSGAVYSLTIPAGTSDNPTEKIFAIKPGAYNRITSQCNGLERSSLLVVNGNLRLIFTPCGVSPTATSTP
jgi:hypothetical protein